MNTDPSMRGGPSDLLWDRWEEVDRLLAEALELPAGGREAFVRLVAADDIALRDLVLRLTRRLDERGRHSRHHVP